MSKESNGRGTFALTGGGITLDVISITPSSFVLDDDVDTTTNSNGDFRSIEAGEFISVGPVVLTVPFDNDVYKNIVALYGVTDTGTLTSKSGGSTAYSGFVKSYEPDEQSPADMPTATFTFSTQTGTDGDTGPVITPAV
jgi:hypothetical protein